MFEIGDIIRHKMYNWYALVLNVEPLFANDDFDSPVGYMFKCHRFDCGGYTFNQLDLHMCGKYIKVNDV